MISAKGIKVYSYTNQYSFTNVNITRCGRSPSNFTLLSIGITELYIQPAVRSSRINSLSKSCICTKWNSVLSYDVVMSYCRDHFGRHFRVYLLRNWIHLDETWQMDGRSKKEWSKIYTSGIAMVSIAIPDNNL